MKITLEQAISYLNSLVKADPSAMDCMFHYTVSCNQELVNHPTAQVRSNANGDRITIMGILNGMFGTNEDGSGLIAARYNDTDELIDFVSNDKTNTLPSLGVISDDEIMKFISQQYRTPVIDLGGFTIKPEILALISHELCVKRRVLPVTFTDSTTLMVAMADSTDLHAIDDLKFWTGFNIKPVLASERTIMEHIERYYSDSNGQ
jgi:hypothetical protein